MTAPGPAAMSEHCDACRFYSDITPSAGVCRRFPPNRDGLFPKVAGINWCGEWKPKTEEPQP